LITDPALTLFSGGLNSLLVLFCGLMLHIGIKTFSTQKETTVNAWYCYEERKGPNKQTFRQ
jgi:hypothetical protein